jgi:CRISPR/Cas system Type II protein with McrA/HNH and RuvC-like nuclease domain
MHDVGRFFHKSIRSPCLRKSDRHNKTFIRCSLNNNNDDDDDTISTKNCFLFRAEIHLYVRNGAGLQSAKVHNTYHNAHDILAANASGRKKSKIPSTLWRFTNCQNLRRGKKRMTDLKDLNSTQKKLFDFFSHKNFFPLKGHVRTQRDQYWRNFAIWEKIVPNSSK